MRTAALSTQHANVCRTQRRRRRGPCRQWLLHRMFQRTTGSAVPLLTCTAYRFTSTYVLLHVPRTTWTYLGGQEVCREGQRDHRMFIILSGTLIVEHKMSPSSSSSNILCCSAPGPISLGAGRSVELRTGEALGILSALAGRPKNSNVFAGPHGCQLGVVPAWALGVTKQKRHSISP